MALTASVSFGGFSGIRSVRFPFGRGVTPSACCITFVAGGGTVAGGTLSLSYNGQSLEFPEMAVASSHIRKSYDGKWSLRSVILLDRRWKWAGIRIAGDWNRRMDSGIVDTSTQKTPGELAAMLLDQLGESGYDVSSMPVNVRPRAHWDGIRCDLALQKLCEDVCCEVVLNPLTNRVEIWPLGTGSETPEGVGEVHPKRRFAPRAYVPSSVVIACGPSLYQYRLQLQAIGRQSNLQEMPLNAVDWAAGLTSTESFNFPNLVSNQLNQTLALATAWRHFRVQGQEGGGLQVPGCPVAVSTTAQYDLKDYILFSVRDVNGFLQRFPYYVEGDFWAYTDLANNGSNNIFLGPTKLYPERQIIETEHPVVKLTATGALEVPTLYLQAAYSVKHPNGIHHRVYRSTNIGGSGGVLNVYHPEFWAAYSATANTEAQANAEADAYLTLYQRKYQSQTASEITYPGLVFGALNGNIAQASWEWSVNDAPRTTFCEGDELDVAALSSREKRRNLQVEATL